MNHAEVWRLLGIDPTDDRRAIRRAYAERLRAMDTDADVAGFEALRVARDVALADDALATVSHVALMPLFEAAAADGPDDEGTTVRPGARQEPATEPASMDAPERVAQQQPDPAAIHMQAISELIHREQAEPWFEPEDRAALMAHWRALRTDPRMEEIDFRDRVERWTAWAILSGTPLASPLIVPAVQYFGWTADDGKVSQAPALVEICRRHHLIRFLEAASNPGHSHHPAWAELHEKAWPGSSRGRVDPGAVHDILTVVRAVIPEVELRFDPQRVQLWANNTADPDHPEELHLAADSRRVMRVIRLGYFGLGLIFLLISIVVAVSESSR